MQNNNDTRPPQPDTPAPAILIIVSGGSVQNVVTNDLNIQVHLCDVDNLLSGGATNDQIESFNKEVLTSMGEQVFHHRDDEVSLAEVLRQTDDGDDS